MRSCCAESMRVLRAIQGAEDMADWCPGWGEVASSKARKQYFSSAGNRRGGQFNTEHVYTFHFWQHLLDLAAWQLSTGFATFDLRRHLAGQPLRAMAELPSGERLWDFELAHDGGAC